MSRAQSDQTSAAESLTDLGEIARKQGAYAQARQLFEESLALHLQVGNGRALRTPRNVARDSGAGGRPGAGDATARQEP